MLSLASLQQESGQPKTEKPKWPDWQGQTVICLATGPSLTLEQVELAKSADAKVIAINDLGLPSRDPTAYWCDIWYAADWQFWDAYQPEAAASKALKVSAEREPVAKGLADLYMDTHDDEKALQRIPGFAISGGHSGCQVVQLAISLGAKRIVLAGYDCKPQGDRTNYFGRKPEKLHRNSQYKSWPKAYQLFPVPAGVEILNASIDTAVTRYPRVAMADVL